MNKNKPESPYNKFWEADENNPEAAQAKAEFEKYDRGEPEIKVEREAGVNKNIVIGIGMAIATVAIVVFFVIFMVSKFKSEPEIEQVENLALSKIEHLSLERNMQNIEAAKQKEAERQRLRRERLAREAREAQEKNKQPAKQEQVVEVVKEQPAAKPELSLGNLGESRADKKPLKTKKEEELTAEELAALRKGRGDVLAYSSNAKPKDSGQSMLERPNHLGSMLITERHANGLARVRASRKYLLMAGTNIPCTILPRVITNYYSQPTCLVNEDVYSPEGIVLIDRGSKVIGEQRTTLRRGSKRVFIAWADIETPYGVTVKIDSMAADALGGSGADAWVDNHWVERFGAAIMLSFVDDLFEVLANEVAKGGNENTWENSTDNASNMAAIALEDSIKIEPTGYIMPAKQTNIIVARDVDFTEIYQTN